MAKEKIAVVAGHRPERLARDFDYYIGVDAGCLSIMQADLPLTLAVGDFDSVKQEEEQTIQNYAKKCIKLRAEKADTDLEWALKEVVKTWPEAEIVIYGGLGGRLDHALTNIFLPSHPDLGPFMSQFQLINKQNLLRFYPAGRHTIQPKKPYHYVSFVVEGGGVLEITGAKYELKAQNYFSRKVYVSNAFLKSPIQVSLCSGYLVVIYSKDT